MVDSLRIATWNLDRSGVRKRSRWESQLAQIQSHMADVWILTEAHRGQEIPKMHPTFSAAGTEPYKPQECAVAIWSKWESRLIGVADPRVSTCAEVHLPGSDPRLLVYGTIIPYHGDGVRQGEAATWERHRKGAQVIAEDCANLRHAYPDHVLVLAGDFNMSLDGTKWYGLNDVKTGLQKELTAAQLTCCTLDDLRERRHARANVDHIWTSNNSAQVGNAHYWFGLSDHNGVVVEIDVSHEVGIRSQAREAK
jgi:endonuclease/exonuclease/phosphatase family metal-dependent hydrolase